MTKKQFRTRLTVLILLVLLLIGLIGFAEAKYATTISYRGTITFSASLATSVILQEHKAVPQADGSYVLGTEVVKENTYRLLPGLDIPKDPHIIIEGKTPIPAYLFVEVTDTLDVPVTYQMDDNWLELTDIPKTDGVKVYYYRKALTNDDMTDGKITIQILKDDKVTVSQYLLNQSDNAENDTDILKFSVKLVEKYTNANDPAQAYRGYPPQN